MSTASASASDYLLILTISHQHVVEVNSDLQLHYVSIKTNIVSEPNIYGGSKHFPVHSTT